jgi:hypothetical protein
MENLPATGQFPFVPPLLHGNFITLKDISHQFGLHWTRPPPLHPLAHKGPLAQWISRPATCIFEDPDDLTDLSQNPSSSHNWSASPEERHVQHKSTPPASFEYEQELSPYVEESEPDDLLNMLSNLAPLQVSSWTPLLPPTCTMHYHARNYQPPARSLTVNHLLCLGLPPHTSC